MKEIKRQTRGITLVALVVTIIVLLILAGVAISLTVGENGLFSRALRASEEHKIAQYKEEINLIIMEEIAERQIEVKEELLIQSLDRKILEKRWVESTTVDNNHLKVSTIEGYEIIIEVDNDNLTAKIIEIAEKDDEEQEEQEESISATLGITNNKFTEGSLLNINVNSSKKIQKVEAKVGDTIIYVEDNINSAGYTKNVTLEELSNLAKLPFYDNITVSLEATSATGLQDKKEIAGVKNYTVNTEAQLSKFADIVNGGNNLQNETIVQLEDIDVNLGMWTENADGSTTFKSGAKQWKVIGSEEYVYNPQASYNIKSFAGIYDGKNHKIEGIYINAEKDTVGLFERNAGTIKNVILKHSIIKGRYNVGGIASGNEGGTIENCKNYASVSGTNCVGGIASWSNGALSGNTNYGEISTGNGTGWKFEREALGGITGWGENIIINCKNYGKITSTLATSVNGIGGITGATSQTLNISNCINYGIVSGNKINVAGIIGLVRDNSKEHKVIVTKCYNTGSITGGYVGGINGCGVFIQIEDCYNTGTIQGTANTGGIVSWAGVDSPIINCYNVGRVTGTPTNLVGGILGRYNELPILTNCYTLNTASEYAVGDDHGAWGNLDNKWVGHVEMKEDAEMKSLAATLGNNWSDDKENVNGGYPILK